jgi:primosomal protein N' (replication factor Y)
LSDPSPRRPPYVEVVVNRPVARRPVTRDSEAPPPPAGEEPPATRASAQAFTYAVPEPWREIVQPGQLVEVPFRDLTLQGVVVALADAPPEGIVPRPIVSILDATPVLSPIQLELAAWLSEAYLAPLSECIGLFLPPGARRSPQLMAEAVPDRTLPPDMDARAAALYLYLQRRGPTPVAELEASTLRLLTDIEAVRVWQRLAPPRAGPHLDRTVELIASPEEVTAALSTLGRPSKQADVLLHLAASADPLPTLSEVLAAVGCGEDVVRRLAERGAVQLTPRRSLVATPLTGPGLAAALAELESVPDQQAALAWFRHHPGPHALPLPGVATATLAALEKKGYLRRWTEPATVSLTLAPEEVWPLVTELRGLTRHAQVLDLLAREEGRVWVGWVYVHTDATLETLRQLAAAGLVELDEARHWRDPLAEQPRGLDRPPVLTPEQATAAEAIRAAAAEPRAFLLHGVTGSGKTEIYLRAVADALARGQGAIVLVPEIALTVQTIQRVAARFPGRVAIWHSDLSLGERFDTWQRVQSGDLPVVVGPRSALFAPVRNLGLIVVDEEHEPAYKSERTPRYHAREVALRLGELSGAVVILGSATPDVTTYRRTERGELILLSLPQRVLAHRQVLAGVGGAVPRSARPVNGVSDLCALPLPPVEVVDLAAELKAGNRSIFSRALQSALRETLDAGRQAILFLNRRGTATFVLCRDCGYVVRCRHCDVALTYHADQVQLICHHCNRRQANPQRCPACGSARIRYFGLGTERVEEAVRALLPGARLLRWDADTARLRGSHAAYLDEFARRRADILIGTQMIAKGLDLPGVTLVGVISADTALYLPDFRAAERTFQLLTQVAGRAGRSPLGGRVIIQTYHPDLPLIRAAAHHDYATFYADELRARMAGRYPPFKRLARLVFSGSGAERAQQEAERMAAYLRAWVARRGEPGVEVVGPAPCFYPRLGGQHRWHILMRADQPERLLRDQTWPLGWRVDVDPVDLL